MLDLAELRRAFRLEQARYEKLARRVKTTMADGLRDIGVYAEVTSRVKEEPNFLRKALKKSAEEPDKHADPLASIHDRAGVRAIVLHSEAARAASDLVAETFESEEFEDTRVRLAPNELGYLGLHHLVRLKRATLEPDELDLEGLICEIQIHTKAENAWASVSHPMLYKPIGRRVSPVIARHVNRAVALVELFDEEIMRARREIVSEPGYRPAAMLADLEAEFLRVAYQDYDDELSLQVLRGIEGAYDSQQLEHFKELIAEHMRTHRPVIETLLAHYKGDPAAHPLLFQPEVLAIHERLANAPETLRSAWLRDSPFDIDLLDSLRDVLGR